MSEFTASDVAVLKQIPALCPHVELDGSKEAFADYLNDLAERIAVLVPKSVSALDLKVEGIGEVIQPDDPRHPKYQAA
jgi:hypothetical protein